MVVQRPAQRISPRGDACEVSIGVLKKNRAVVEVVSRGKDFLLFTSLVIAVWLPGLQDDGYIQHIFLTVS
jgi:hypothetical protein